MMWLLWLVPALPFAGATILTLFGGRLSRRGQAWVGVGAVGLAALTALLVTYDMVDSPPADDTFRETLWTWFEVGGLKIDFTLLIDPLAVIMMLVVTVVGFLIHLYSAAHMAEDDGYRRFFAFMNLFVGSMLLLVLADNLLLLFLGWEGVGLCSYLLIGFWYRDPINGWAARKAFIVTRVGDSAFMIGLVLLVTQLGTLSLFELQTRALNTWASGSAIAVVAAALLLGGAVGKSAQIPLHTWLPDAMAGPSPVSALIHAATMVTAGVYLIARTDTLFLIAPQVRTAVGVIGAVTLLYAALSALAQHDIKRVLAYSTISQIGYMFVALGVGAWSAAIFHLMTHAFFKALLFLSAGVVIDAQAGEHDIFRMGGLRQRLPLTFWSFVIGAASLAALPLVTAGFYSKELILEDALLSVNGSVWLWAAGLFGAFITALYIFRVVFVVFFGPVKIEPVRGAFTAERISLVVLSVLSVAGGLVWTPTVLGGYNGLGDYLGRVLPSFEEHHTALVVISQILAPEVGIVGVIAAWFLYRPGRQPGWMLEPGPVRVAVSRYWTAGWGFDWLYDRLFVRPFLAFARMARGDLVEPAISGLVWLNRSAWGVLSRTQSGLLRLYAAAAGVGAAVLILIVLIW
jgi:NADH-quinone oxidoreductase subunit L